MNFIKKSVMKDEDMEIDHIGYAVRKMDRAIESFQKLGFVFGPVVDDRDRNVRISFGEKDGYRIELVSPMEKTKESPVDHYLERMPGMPYHVCYRSAEFDSDIARLQGEGYRIVIAPKPAVAFDGRRVVFMMDLGMGLMEIVEA